MRTNIMISSRLTRRGFCYSALSIALAAAKKLTVYRLPEAKPIGLYAAEKTLPAAKKLTTHHLSTHHLPDPKFQIGDRVRTERICNDRISQNFGGIDWECGFVVGYVWQFDECLKEDFQKSWTYWIRYDQTNNEIFGDRPWLDFAHQSEIIRA